jgi:tetratricopeptide (TPR) repeat protein
MNIHRGGSQEQPKQEQSNKPPRPDFLSHVDRPAIEKALAIAKERHVRAVQQALRNYNTDAVDIKETTTDSAAATPFCRLKEHAINAPGALPDFGTELARTVLVTDPEPLFTEQECSRIIQLAEDYFTEHHNGEWTTQQSGQYSMAGFWIRDIPEIHVWFVETVKRRLFTLLQHQYPDFIDTVADLVVDNAYLFKYTAETGRRTDVHTDSGCLSFTMALNPASDYEGGGTWFEGLEKQEHVATSTTAAAKAGVIEMDVGQVTIRPGGVKHCGNAIHSGVRYIIGGFCMHRHKIETVRQLLTPDATTSTKQQTANLEAAIVMNPECDAAYNLLANAYEQAGDKAGAVTVLEYCLQHVHPLSGEVAYSLGSLYMEQGRYAQVQQCMETCLRADPCDVDAMMALAQAHAGLGNGQAEEDTYQTMIRTPANGSNYNKVMASAYCNLGVLHEGEPVEVEYYQKSLAYLPDNFQARYSLGSAYASRSQWPEAVQAFREAIDRCSASDSVVGGGTEQGNADVDADVAKALQSLYKVAMQMIRSSSAPPQSREEMMQCFQNVMGADNYDRLAANAGAGASAA